MGVDYALHGPQAKPYTTHRGDSTKQQRVSDSEDEPSMKVLLEQNRWIV